MPMSEVLDGGRLKGGMLRSHIRWVEQNLGVTGFDGVKSKVSPETAKLLSGPILATVFYPFRALVELDRAIAACAGMDEKEVVTELGIWSAKINLEGAYKAFQKEKPHEFFVVSARLHTQFQDFGRAEYEKLGETHCRMSMLDYPCWSKIFCWSAVGFFTEATRIQGGQDPKVFENECKAEGGKACRFDIHWS